MAGKSSRDSELLEAVLSLFIGGVIVWFLYDAIDPIREDKNILFIITVATLVSVYIFIKVLFDKIGQ